jgi:hypothetical protein
LIKNWEKKVWHVPEKGLKTAAVSICKKRKKKKKKGKAGAFS